MKNAPESALERVQAIREALPESHEFDERDLALLTIAEQQARDLDALVADVRERGVATTATN